MLYKLKKNYEFARVFRQGKRRPGKHLALHYRCNGLDYNRAGFTTVRHYGNAVERNKMRRWLREAYRHLAPELHSGYDIILMGIRKGEDTDYQAILSDLYKAFRKEKILNEEKTEKSCEVSSD